MPENGDAPQTFGEQLAAALTAKKVSKSELARRLGGKPASKRRWIQKLVNDDVETPERESIEAIERALKLRRGHFVMPTVDQRRAEVASRATLERRLEELATLVDEGLARLEAGIARVERRLDGRADQETTP